VSDGEKLTAIGRETPGHRFMLGLTTLADSRRYDLPSASLQTHVTGPTGTAFSTAGGRTFVAPTDGSLAAIAQAISPDRSTGLWPIDYTKLRTSAAGAKVYPGTTVVYLAAPTTGLPAADAANMAQLMSFVATSGQSPGHGNGQLPPGYVPLSKADGLSALADFTVRAATAVVGQRSAQPAAVWALQPFSLATSTKPDSTPASSGTSGTGAHPTGSRGGPSSASGPPGVSVPTAPATTTTSASQKAPTVAQTVALGITPSVKSGVAASLLPLFLLLSLVSAAVALLSNSTRRLRRRA
jgi:hypothetical protein